MVSRLEKLSSKTYYTGLFLVITTVLLFKSGAQDAAFYTAIFISLTLIYLGYKSDKTFIRLINDFRALTELTGDINKALEMQPDAIQNKIRKDYTQITLRRCNDVSSK